jgi:hypothetical protein
MYEAVATTPAPEQQHMVALRRANAIRLARATLKHRVAGGELTAAEVVAEPPECALSMSMMELLCAQHRWKTVRARRFLTEVGMAEQKKLGTLTMRQRIALAALLPDGEGASARLHARARAEQEFGHGPCTRMNGSGPCLRPAGHNHACVIAVHAPALGFVYFRNGITDELVASVEVALGGACPSTRELVGLLAAAEAERR